MDDKLNEIMVLMLEYRKFCEKENIGEDEMETKLLDTMDSAGFDFSRY